MAESKQAILLRIGADVSQLRKELASGSSAVNIFTKDIDISRNAIVKYAGTIAAGLGLAALGKEAVQFADEVKRVADATGLSTDEVQRLQFIASQTGVAVDSLTGTIAKMSKTLVSADDDGKQARKAIADLGLDVNKLLAMQPQDAFQEISVAIAGMANPMEQSAAAMAVFGKSGAEALPMIKAMASEGEALSAQFDAIGGPASAAAIDAVDKIGDSAAAVGVQVKGLATELLAMGAESILSGLQAVHDTLAGIKVLLGKGSNEVVNIDREIDGLTLSLEQFDKNNPFPDAFGEKLRSDLVKSIKALKEQQEVILGVGDAGSSMNVVMQDFGNIMLEMPKITEEALGVTDELLDAAVQRQIAREQQVTDNLKEQADLRHEIAAYGTGKIEEVQGAHFSKMDEWSMKSWDTQVAIVAGSLKEMTAGIAQHSKTAFEVNKAASMAETIVNTIVAVTKAWKDYGWPYGAVIGAAIAAAGAAQLNAIRSTQFNGGGRGVPPSGATTAPVNTASAGSGNGGGGGGGGVLRVEGLSGDALFDAKSTRALAERLLEYQKNGGQVVFNK